MTATKPLRKLIKKEKGASTINTNPPQSPLVRGKAFEPPLIRGGLEGFDNIAVINHLRG